MRRLLLFLSLAAAWPAPKPPTVELRTETLAAFEEHVRTREHAIDRQHLSGSQFLWVDHAPDRLRRVRSGQVVVDPVENKGVVEIKGGMIHDWVGAVFVPSATLPKVMAGVRNYDNHKNLYRPEVIDSRTLSQQGDNFKIHLRLLKKKILTVVLNTEHDVRYFPLDKTRVHSRSYSTRIQEVDDPGKPAERQLPVGNDHGFLWRLNSYWRFQERDGGVYVECEAISLTRGVPTGFGWLITPIVRDLPRESLTNTLGATRQAFD